MKVKAFLDIELTEEQKKEIAIEFLQKKFDLNENCYFQDGNIYYWEHYKGTCYKPDSIFLREANELDEAILKILNDLK